MKKLGGWEKMNWNKSVRNVLIFNLLNNLSFERVLWIAYLLEKNISLIQIGLIQSILNISMTIFELPTGFVADKYGRKVSIFIGNLFVLLYLLIFLLSNEFIYFVIGSVIYGIGATFVSGSSEALIYDNLKGLKLEKKYDSILGKVNFMSVVGLLISILAGGILQKYLLESIFIAGIVFRLFCGFSILKIYEFPYIETKSVGGKEVFNINKFLKKYKYLIGYLIISSLFISLFSIYVIFGQQILKINGEDDLLKISIILSLLYLSSGVVSLFYSKLKKIISYEKLLFFNGIIIFTLLWLTTADKLNSYYYLVFIAIGALFEINNMTYEIIINKMTSSEVRARVFSFYSFITTGFMSLFSIIITFFLGDRHEFNYNFFLMASIILGISTVISIILTNKFIDHKKKILKPKVFFDTNK